MTDNNYAYWGVNLSHDASICQVSSTGEIDWFVEEERFSKVKHSEIPDVILSKVKYEKELKKLQISGLYEEWNKRDFECYAKSIASSSKKYYNIVNYNNKKHVEYELYFDHHLFHAACGFYNSGFESAAVLVVDGMGNYINKDYQEVETIYTAEYPNKIGKYHVNVTTSYAENNPHSLDKIPLGIGMIHSAIADYFGFGQLGSGSLMGLSPYGTEDPNIKPFIINGIIDSSQFYRTKYGCNFIPYEYVRYDGSAIDNLNPKFLNICNLAYRIQKDFEDYMINLILYTLKITGQKNLVLTGGCALNCVANYKYLSVLPEDVNLYIEPISTDAGISIGLAKIQHYYETQSMEKHPLKTLYLGLE
jgi:carbamoyltransferase